MVRLFGKDYTKEELLARVGDISQVGGVTQKVLDSGAERGVRAIDFRTGLGFDFTVLADRGLDISMCTFNGQPLNWRAACGDKSPAFYEEPGLGWLRNFYGGLVVTCGMTTAGAPSVDEGKQLGLHGRFSNTPASNVYADGAWHEDEYFMWAEGKIREAVLFGENIECKRTVTAKLGEPRLWIVDEVTNLGIKDTPHMMLYHINIGFPVIDGGARLISPTKSYQPRDAEAEIGKEQYAEFPDPVPGFKERCYYHEMAEDEDGMVTAAIANPNFDNGKGFGVYIRYPKEQLPKFTQWKMVSEQEYVCGLEPANCWVQGRAMERERGTLQILKPGETREYHVEIGALCCQGAIAEIEEAVNKALGR